jgi:hypothetical protein
MKDNLNYLNISQKISRFMAEENELIELLTQQENP